MKFIAYTSLLFMSLFFNSCGDETTTIEAPSSYTFMRDGATSVSYSGQTTRISMAEELSSALTNYNLSEATLLELYSNMTADGSDADPYTDANLNESTKSIESKVAASSDFFAANTTEASIIKAELRSWIELQVRDVFTSKDQLAAAGIAGQIADGTSVRYVNEKGLEYNQAVAKTLIGAVMVDQICNNYLSISVLDAGNNTVDNTTAILEDGKNYTSMEHKWDEAYGYLFGKSADGSDPIATLGDDGFLNKYLARVDSDSDFAGIATDIFNAFKLGRAAIVAADYNVRDAQAEIIREKISEVIAIRAVYYLQNGKNALANNDMGGAFHDLSEGYGFIKSLRFTRKANSIDSYFSKSEVDDMISRLTTGNGFWDLTAQTLDEVSEEIATKFSFIAAQAAN